MKLTAQSGWRFALMLFLFVPGAWGHVRQPEETMKASTQGRYRILPMLSLLVCGGWACAHPPGQQQSTQQPSAQPTSAQQPLAQSASTQQPSAQPTSAQQTFSPPTSNERAQEVLRAARTALGGEEKLRSVRSLSLAGEMRRETQPGNTQSGEIKLEFLLPNKFLRTETLSLFAGAEISFLTCLNGHEAWEDSRASGGSANMNIMRPPQARRSKDQQEELLKKNRAEFTRNLLALLLTPPSSLQLQFASAGEAQAQDGRVDVLDVTGPDGFTARLFFDQKTHLPVMMNYRGVVFRVTINRGVRASSKEEAEKLGEAARQKSTDASANASRQETEIQMRFSDYRAVEGILLPRHITRAVDGKAIEEWNLKTIKVNPALKPQSFRK